ncbi:MAG: GNAT family N-acetyltransferase [Clostridia bacterium]|nr:GNAT family N-acetyltransferase [Clostridia bacterium]
MMKKELQKTLYGLLALEYNCSPDDFKKDKNILTVSKIIDGRRIYSPEKYFFHMVTTGNNAVITADECLHPFLEKFIANRCGHWLFEQPNILGLERELNKFGHTLTASHHMFLPAQKIKRDKPFPFEIRWFFDEEIMQFYGDERFPNAICEEFTPTRPDRLVVCAYDNGKIVGMAGCSEDAPHWMQIGIDVMQGYRSSGIGTNLVSILRKKIEENGDIPFYGTSLSNYHSWNIALNCGFRPAWVEIGSKKR